MPEYYQELSISALESRLFFIQQTVRDLEAKVSSAIRKNKSGKPNPNLLKRLDNNLELLNWVETALADKLAPKA